jgi:hypothetical protein
MLIKEKNLLKETLIRNIVFYYFIFKKNGRKRNGRG